MECGKLSPVKKEHGFADNVKFFGRVQLARVLNGTIYLSTNPRKTDASSENVPEYIVQLQPRGWKDAYKAGVAWLKHSDKTADFLSITLDDPEWKQPLNLAAFYEGDDLNIVWTRPRGKTQSSAQSQTSDEIPY